MLTDERKKRIKGSVKKMVKWGKGSVLKMEIQKERKWWAGKEHFKSIYKKDFNCLNQSL